DADGPTECHAVLTQTFAQAGFLNYLDVPSYFEFLLDEIDLEGTFEVHKRTLQMLQHRAAPRRWTLKYPNHLLSMDAIRAIYPDSRFVVTHRDPVQTLASLCKLTLDVRTIYADKVDPKTVGRQIRHFVRRHLDKFMDFATGPNATGMSHVDYYRLVEA